MLSPTAWRSHATLVSVCTEASEPAFPSAGIRLAWRDHADLVIAEEIVRPRDLVLGHVTGYAVLRCFRARLRHPCVLDVAGLRRAGVLLAGPMAALAQHARRQPLHLHLAFTNRVGRMAAEAVRGVPNTHPAARGLLEGFGMQTRGAHGEIEP